MIPLVLLSLARGAALRFNYGAPEPVYAVLGAREAAQSTPRSVCVGSEWYRFPSHFYLPSHVNIAFVRSRVGGLLPQYYGPWPEGSRVVPEGMNDLNQEDLSRYVRLFKASARAQLK